MPPLSGEQLRVTPKSKAEVDREAALERRESEAYQEAKKLLPLNAAKRGKPTETVKAMYQTEDQQGSKLWTRAWLRRRGISEIEPIEIHTDTIELTTSNIRRVPADDDNTERAALQIPRSLYEPSVDIDGHDYVYFNDAQKNQALAAIEDTLDQIADAVTVRAATTV